MSSNPLDLVFYGLFVLVNRPALDGPGRMEHAATILAVNPAGNDYGVMGHSLKLRFPAAVLDPATKCTPDTDPNWCVWRSLERFKVIFGDPQNPSLTFDSSTKDIGHFRRHDVGDGLNEGVLEHESQGFLRARFDLFSGVVRSLGRYRTKTGDLQFTFKRRNGTPVLPPATGPLGSGIVFSTSVSGALYLMPLDGSGLPNTIKIQFKRGVGVLGDVVNEPDAIKPDPTSGDVEVSHFRAYYLFMKEKSDPDEIPVPHFRAEEAAKAGMQPRVGTKVLRPGSPTCPPDQQP